MADTEYKCIYIWLLRVWLCCWCQNVWAQYQFVCIRVNICGKNSLHYSLILESFNSFMSTVQKKTPIFPTYRFCKAELAGKAWQLKENKRYCQASATVLPLLKLTEPLLETKADRALWEAVGRCMCSLVAIIHCSSICFFLQILSAVTDRI